MAGASVSHVVATAAPSDVALPAQRPARWRHPATVLPGLAVCAPVAVAAWGLGHLAPAVGGPVFGIVLGMAAAPLVRPGRRLTPGVTFASKRLLPASVVLLGTGLSLSRAAHTGLHSLPVMLVTLGLALTAARVVGRRLGVGADLRVLIGAGTGICGASAIAATTTVIGAAGADVAYAVSTIFTFNVVAVLLYPAIGHLLGLSQQAFGLWAGTAVNDTSSVLAAGYAYGPLAGDHALVVKLTRTLMIVPICVGLVLLRARAQRRATGGADLGRVPWRRLFPGFVAGFVLAAALNSAGVVPAGWHPGLSSAATWLITFALAGIGLSTRFGEIRRTGHRPLVLGAVLWATVAVSGLALQGLAGLF